MQAHVAVAISAKRRSPLRRDSKSMPPLLICLCRVTTDDLRQFRTSPVPGAATVPVYVVSGWPQDRLEPESGFAGYFLKPIDLNAVVAKLQPLPRRLRRLRS